MAIAKEQEIKIKIPEAVSVQITEMKWQNKITPVSSNKVTTI